MRNGPNQAFLFLPIEFRLKSDGNRLAFLFTCSFNRFVDTPYNSPRFESIITFCPRSKMPYFMANVYLIIIAKILSNDKGGKM